MGVDAITGGRNVVIITSSPEKYDLWSRQLGDRNVGAERFVVSRGLPEPVHVSPRKVIGGKMETFLGRIRAQGQDRQGGGFPDPLAYLVLDVLAIYAPEGPGGFGAPSNRILTKPEPGQDPLDKATSYWQELLRGSYQGVMHWFAYVPTVGVKPNETDVFGRERSMFFWDPIWVAWSHGLLKILADRGRVREMTENGMIPSGTFTQGSINGVKMELLIPVIAKLAAERDGDDIGMLILHGRLTHEVDARGDLNSPLLKLLALAVINGTPRLFDQVARLINSGRPS